jgi:outer membrane immunogenic protein
MSLSGNSNAISNRDARKFPGTISSVMGRAAAEIEQQHQLRKTAPVLGSPSVMAITIYDNCHRGRCQDQHRHHAGLRIMLKKLIFASALAGVPSLAFAADLPIRYKAPVNAVTPLPFSWTGFYVGFNVGGAFDNSDRVDVSGLTSLGLFPDALSLRNKSSGVTAGGQAGYNYEFSLGNLSGIVLGLEADAAYTDLSSELPIDSGGIVPGSTVNLRSRLDYLGTIRGRLGYSYDRFLVYGTGGFAYGTVEHSASLQVPGVGTLANANLKTTEIGFAYGGGVEYALPFDSFFHLTNSSAITLRAEYLRYDLGDTNANFSLAFPPAAASIKLRDVGNIARAGLNYKF